MRFICISSMTWRTSQAKSTSAQSGTLNCRRGRSSSSYSSITSPGTSTYSCTNSSGNPTRGALDLADTILDSSNSRLGYSSTSTDTISNHLAPGPAVQTPPLWRPGQVEGRSKRSGTDQPPWYRGFESRPVHVSKHRQQHKRKKPSTWLLVTGSVAAIIITPVASFTITLSVIRQLFPHQPPLGPYIYIPGPSPSPTPARQSGYYQPQYYPNPVIPGIPSPIVVGPSEPVIPGVATTPAPTPTTPVPTTPVPTTPVPTTPVPTTSPPVTPTNS